MQTRLIAFGFIFIWITYKLSYNEAIEFKFTNAVCESFNKSFIVIHNCRLRAISRNKTVFNFNATMLYSCNNIVVQAQFFKKANGYKPWLYKLTVDICRFLRKSYNPVVNIVFHQFKEFSNLNHTCPYVGPQIVQGFYLRHELVRLPIPTGDYLLTLTWIFDKRPQSMTNFYFAYKENLI